MTAPEPVQLADGTRLVFYRETLRATLQRTLSIGALVTTVLVLLLPYEGSWLRFWAVTYLAVLWFPLGGHYVELAYLNGIRWLWPRCRRHPYVTRVAWWMLAGLPLGVGCWFTWTRLGYAPPFELPVWWGAPFFPVTEFAIHGILTALGRPSFWNNLEGKVPGPGWPMDLSAIES